MIRFAHIADCHVGAWREPKMRELNLLQFSKTIDDILEQHKIKPIEFLIIAGDLFNTAVPSVDALKLVTEKLKEVKDQNIRIYGVAGSHDYSASGKSMLEVLEKADLFTDLVKGEIVESKLKLNFTQDPSGVKLAGMRGKKGSLDKHQYSSIDHKAFENEPGRKIFVFHSAIEEFKPEGLENMEGTPMAALPKTCAYYAGGHVHYRFTKKTLDGTIVFPGPLCPNNYKEWVDLEYGSYALCEMDDNGNTTVESRKVAIKEIKHIIINSIDQTPIEIYEKIESQFKDIEDKLILITITGKLGSGTIADLHFERLLKDAYIEGAYCMLRNTSMLNTIDMDVEAIEVKDINEIETEVIDQKIEESGLKDIKGSEISYDNQKKFINSLMNTFSIEKREGETAKDFEERLEEDFNKLLENGI